MKIVPKEKPERIFPGTLFRVRDKHPLVIADPDTEWMKIANGSSVGIMMYLKTERKKGKTFDYHWFLDSNGRKIWCPVHPGDKKWFFEKRLRKIEL